MWYKYVRIEVEKKNIGYTKDPIKRFTEYQSEIILSTVEKQQRKSHKQQPACYMKNYLVGPELKHMQINIFQFVI